MTADPNSPIHFLNGLTPDPAALTDARAFALMLPEPRHMAGRVEDLCLCFSHFITDEKNTGPRLPGAHSEALNVFTFAMSGLFAFLEDAQRPGQEGGWATLARARMWAVDKCQQAGEALTPEAVEGLHLAFSNRYTLPTWASQQGRTLEAARLAAWWTVAHLLEAAPHLEDGEAEDLTAAVLEALTPGPYPYARAAHLTTQLFASPDSVPDAPTVYTAQYVEPIIGGVRVGMGGGEFYEVTRAQVSFTPLPDGSAFLALLVNTPDMHTVRLAPADARTVCEELGFDYPDGSGPLSHLN